MGAPETMADAEGRYNLTKGKGFLFSPMSDEETNAFIESGWGRKREADVDKAARLGRSVDDIHNEEMQLRQRNPTLARLLPMDCGAPSADAPAPETQSEAVTRHRAASVSGNKRSGFLRVTLGIGGVNGGNGLGSLNIPT